MSDELEVRFGRVARGRRVSVRFEASDFVLALDYQVRFRQETNSFEVVLRRGGCFEGAYRCLERWIEAKAERLDGVDSVPPGHVDLRRETMYRGPEKIYEQFRSDLESAVAERVARLEQDRSNEGVSGEVTLEARTRSLIGHLSILQRADADVRRGVLSPHTIELWKAIGLDVFSNGG